MSTKTGLAERMVQRADADELPADHPLRTLAAAYEAAETGFFAVDQTHNVAQFMGSWARARKAWCTYSGEPLI